MFLDFFAEKKPAEPVTILLEELENVKVPLRTRGRTPSTRSGIVPIWVAFLPPDLVKIRSVQGNVGTRKPWRNLRKENGYGNPFHGLTKGQYVKRVGMVPLPKGIDHIEDWNQANQKSLIRVTMECPKEVNIWSIERSNTLR